MYIVIGIVAYAVVFFQAEDGIRYLVRSRGLGDVYKRQLHSHPRRALTQLIAVLLGCCHDFHPPWIESLHQTLSLIHI